MALDAEAQARVHVWEFAFARLKTIVMRCAVELEIPDILEKRGNPISLTELSSILECHIDPLHRVMRFLAFHGVFKATSSSSLSSVLYAPTPLSRLLTRDNMAPFILLQAGQPMRGISVEALRIGKHPELESESGKDTWTDTEVGCHIQYFTDSMECHARSTASLIVENYPQGFKGIETLVDVGGRHGMALWVLVKAFPWIRGINFDLEEVVAKASPREGIEFVGGDMFKSVPKADAVMLMWILHDWSDEACIDILKNCKDAIPEDKGKVMIVDAVIDEDGEGDEFEGARLGLDMVMMAATVKGKERTYKEWVYILNEAGFKRHTVTNIHTIESVIEAYP